MPLVLRRPPETAALSGHIALQHGCPLSGVERTFLAGSAITSQFQPKEEFSTSNVRRKVRLNFHRLCGLWRRYLSNNKPHTGNVMPVKTKLRKRLEALVKGRSLRINGITKSRTVEYNRVYSTVRNTAASAGRKFKMKLGARALTVTRTK